MVMLATAQLMKLTSSEKLWFVTQLPCAEALPPALHAAVTLTFPPCWEASGRYWSLLVRGR